MNNQRFIKCISKAKYFRCVYGVTLRIREEEDGTLVNVYQNIQGKGRVKGEKVTIEVQPHKFLSFFKNNAGTILVLRASYQQGYYYTQIGDHYYRIPDDSRVLVD